MLGKIVELLSGMKFGEFLKAKILICPGMIRSYAPDCYGRQACILDQGAVLQE